MRSYNDYNTQFSGALQRELDTPLTDEEEDELDNIKYDEWADEERERGNE